MRNRRGRSLGRASLDDHLRAALAKRFQRQTLRNRRRLEQNDAPGKRRRHKRQPADSPRFEPALHRVARDRRRRNRPHDSAFANVRAPHRRRDAPNRPEKQGLLPHDGRGPLRSRRENARSQGNLPRRQPPASGRRRRSSRLSRQGRLLGARSTRLRKQRRKLARSARQPERSVRLPRGKNGGRRLASRFAQAVYGSNDEGRYRRRRRGKRPALVARLGLSFRYSRASRRREVEFLPAS